MSSRARYALSLLTLGAITALVLAVLVGSGPAGLRTLAGAISGDADPLELRVLAELRLARALAAFGTGAALAVAGALMQVLLRNPLADPYILGTSGGAAVVALALMMAGATGLIIDLGAFGGALGATFLVFALARSGGAWQSGRLLLTGVVIAAACGAAISLLLAISPESGLRGLLFWLMGDFADVTDARPVLAVAAAGTAVAFASARSLDVLATGERQGALLGLEVDRLRLGIYGLGSLLTAVAVTTAGIVGFVGLVVPHLVRTVGGSSHRVVVPGAALAGGTLLVMADLLARTLVSPRQLPVGAITAAVGVPVFLALLARSGQRAPDH
jgi:iron complex transport system permease protein